MIWSKSKTLSAVLSATAALWFSSGSAAAQTQTFEPLQAGNTLESQVVSLKDQLKYGLRATTPAQYQYIDEVVALVDNGTLPRSMVNIIYQWAQKRNPRVPLPYFQIALRSVAARRGITVP